MDALFSSIALWLLLALASYGVAQAALHGLSLMRRFGRKQSHAGINLLVFVHNQEEQVEGILRTMASMVSRSTGFLSWGRIWVFDMGSSDQTPSILAALSQELVMITVVHLPPDRVGSAYEQALFLCRGAVSIVVDVRGKVDGAKVIATLNEFQ